jgi:large subunit ribosomal protein L24
MPQHVRKGDLVMVMAGDDRGRTGRVLRVLPRHGQVVVEGVNIHRKHVRRSEKNPRGGLQEKESAMDLSNVMPVVDGKPTRVRFQTLPDGSKVRIAVRGGATLGAPLHKADKSSRCGTNPP